MVELWMLGGIPMIYETLNSPSFPSTMAFWIKETLSSSATSVLNFKTPSKIRLPQLKQKIETKRNIFKNWYIIINNFSKQFYTFFFLSKLAQGICKEVSKWSQISMQWHQKGHQHCIPQTLKAFELLHANDISKENLDQNLRSFALLILWWW